MQDAIRIHSRDNVAVALRDLPANTQVEINQQAITLQQEVGRGRRR